MALQTFPGPEKCKYVEMVLRKESEVFIMKKGLTELVFIVDKSSSMYELTEDTIGGFNSMIRKRKEGNVLVSTVLFDTRFETLHDRVPIEKIGKMTEEEYCAGGCTALLDAVGMTIGDIKARQKKQRVANRPEKTIFVIITDGYENSSTIYDYSEIKELVQKQTNLGWEFLFLGANIDAFAEGERLGIKRNRSCKIAEDRIGTRMAYRDVGKFIDEAIEAECMEDVGDEWCVESEVYCESRYISDEEAAELFDDED